MSKPKRLSPEQKRLSDLCKRRIEEFKSIPTDVLLKQAAICREELGL